MLFKQDTPLYSYEVQRESGHNVMYVNFLGAFFVPSISDFPEVMSLAVDYLSKNSNVSRIVFVQQRNYSYDLKQVVFLKELSDFSIHLLNQEKILSPFKLGGLEESEISRRFEFLNYILSLIRSDPFAAYIELDSEILNQKNLIGQIDKESNYKEIIYLKNLEKIQRLFKNLKLINLFLNYKQDYNLGERKLYKKFFRPDIIPNFAFTRLVSSLPENSEILDQYEIGDEFEKSIVTIFKKSGESQNIYHLMPPEYSLEEDHHLLLNLARNVLIDHQPKSEEFTDPERIRQIFFNVSKDLLKELANTKNIKLDYNELNKLAQILVRHTIGFGIIEVLLQDKNLQDISLNAPIVLNSIYLRHSKYEQCITNIIPSQEDADSWAAKFRMMSGRPLDESNPILDTDLNLGNIRARVAIIQQPLSPNGLAYTIRRHRESPWTLPLFIQNKMLDSLSAGLLSFIVDGSRTLLVAGTRSSGKTSLLNSLMLEIMPRYRIIVIEDTPEIAVNDMRDLKYDILRMKVRSALTKTSNEIAADEGIRTSLRLGDSCLIVGEVRSLEAKALYEAMRVGALANVVAGTIHGASPYGIFDRVVNDLKVPVTSFKATDCILVANPIKTSGSLYSKRRLLQITEVRKHWNKDPLSEKGFVDLMRYNVQTDKLEPTEDLINGDIEILKDIASGVKGWAGNWDAIWDNITLRGKIKREIVDVSKKLKMPELLEARFNVLSNTVFHQISEEVNEEIGLPDSKVVFPKWQKWLNMEVKGDKII